MPALNGEFHAKIGVIRLSPVEKKIIDRMSDGEFWEDAKLHICLMDDLGPVRNLRFHVCNLRKKLNPHGYDIAHQRAWGKLFYRIVPQTEVCS